MTFQVTCPKCSTVFSLPESKEPGGITANCPRCDQQIKVKPPSAKPAPPPTAPPLPVPPRRTAPQPAASKADAKAPVALSDSDFLPDAPARKPRVGQDGPIVGKLLDAGDDDAAVGRRSGLLGLLEPLLKTQSPTDASLVLTGLVALAATVAAYWLVLFPLTHQYWAKLFTERGWVPYAILFLTFWSMAILLLKLWKLLSQRQSLTYDLLPLHESRMIHSGNIAKFRQHIEQLPLNPRRDFLVRRVLLALDHVNARGDVQEVGEVLKSQGDIDGARVDGSYTMLHVFIWAVPILGFIGTVIGISDAVSQFSGSLEGAEDLDVIKQSLAGVTSGLALAFDTTLVALAMSMVIMFPANTLQKAEEDLLISIDQYCNDHLLQRLQNAAVPAADASGESPVAAGEWVARLETAGTAFLAELRETLKSTRGSFSGAISSAAPFGQNGGPLRADLSGEFSLGAHENTNGSALRDRRFEDAMATIADLAQRLHAAQSPAGPSPNGGQPVA